MNIIKLSKNSFLEYALTMTNMQSLNFAKEAMQLWDNFYSWNKFAPLCLVQGNEPLCFLFYSISQKNEYLIVHRILTPKKSRGKGYA
ncbi:hypothetical protein CRV08_02250 [Halarcobacter ebronensis]|uniref:N-acetyltransferase domain-containing protein n=1 Tax=Halarcobacter ebronensis TaxID=1462615 RepID=A0A4Q0YFY8_9BACT|nr:hypothetical protein [Halarcobacter ebronensis]RXJ69546.1 hypothetical protein CRV08_02250 [Halarcobacter ebronensis]